MTLGRVKLHAPVTCPGFKSFQFQICLELNLVVDGLCHPVQQAIVGKNDIECRAPWNAGR